MDAESRRLYTGARSRIIKYMHSLKTKLIVAISALVIFLFGAAAYLLIDEKSKELSRDIYLRSRTVAELTAPNIVELYNTFLKEQSFVIFNREIKNIFRKDEDIAGITLYNFSGEILYDSSTERERAYEGEKRTVTLEALALRIKAAAPSYYLESGRTVYLKKDPQGAYTTVDENDRPSPDISGTDRILNIVYPLEGLYAIEFDLSYDALRERVASTTSRITLLLVLGIMLGLGFGWVFAGKITNPIEMLQAGALILAKGNFKTRVKVTTKDEVGVLADTFNRMAAELEISTKALIYKERIAKELEVAAKIQKEILPQEIPHIPGFDIAAALVPAAEIGGDCYDFIQVSPQTHVLYISDVTGHGIPSGIVVSIANALIYSYASSDTLLEILVNANRVLKEKTAHNMFMTLLMLRYAKGKLSYVSAGHPPMLHYHAAGKKVGEEAGGGIALGMVKDIEKMIKEQPLAMRSGDVIALYSDGIPEGVNLKGEQYGIERFKKALNENADAGSADAIKNALLSDVKKFMGNATQADDITLLVIRKTKD